MNIKLANLCLVFLIIMHGINPFNVIFEHEVTKFLSSVDSSILRSNSVVELGFQDLYCPFFDKNVAIQLIVLDACTLKTFSY